MMGHKKKHHHHKDHHKHRREYQAFSKVDHGFGESKEFEKGSSFVAKTTYDQEPASDIYFSLGMGNNSDISCDVNGHIFKSQSSRMYKVEFQGTIITDNDANVSINFWCNDFNEDLMSITESVYETRRGSPLVISCGSIVPLNKHNELSVRVAASSTQPVRIVVLKGSKFMIYGI